MSDEHHDTICRSLDNLVNNEKAAMLSAGNYQFEWNKDVAPGVYFVKIEGENYYRTEKILIFR